MVQNLIAVLVLAPIALVPALGITCALLCQECSEKRELARAQLRQRVQRELFLSERVVIFFRAPLQKRSG